MKIRMFQVVVSWLHMDTANMHIGIIFVISAGLSIIWAEKCEQYSLSMPYKGRYCTGDGVVTQQVASHLCRYQCILSATCKDYNYNTTVGTCTRFSSPCPQSLSDPAMEFAVFTQKPYEQCYDWIPYSSGDSDDARMVYTEYSTRIIGCTQRASNDVVCYFHTLFKKCFGYFGSIFQSALCQRLRIAEGCTIHWVPYIARDPIPPRAVTAGQMANGDRVYVSQFEVGNGPLSGLPGHYLEGAENTVSQYAKVPRRSTTMMMMVILWASFNIHGRTARSDGSLLLTLIVP